MTEKAQQKIRGFYDYQQPMSKTQPAEASDPSKGDMSGDKNTEHRDPNNGAHTFNYKGKVTHMGDNFHDFGKPQAGLGFNGEDKDASLAYLKDRNMKGQEARNWAGGSMQSKLHTGNGGLTAYNGMPVKEVYTPATSQHVPPEQAIKDSTITRQETQDPGNQTKLGKQIRDHKK